jgi:cell division protein FtsL|tara:strand:+ start:881 stop:1159 length:279 start_codon:yes stop_codon:yes gene_type:complete
MSNIKIYTISFLIIANIALSFGIVYVEHLTRSQFRDLQSESNKKFNLRNDWKTARITADTLLSPSRIEKDARNLLNMSLPKDKKWELININD